MKVAIITARGGSKRIPRKNIREFCGKPIIAYSIQAALAAKCFDEVMVSTDDEEIAEVAKTWGAQVPFMRSAKTASDYATTAEVLLEVLHQYQEIGIQPEIMCCIYPTAPFITSENLNTALDMLQQNNNIHSINPIVRFSFPIQRAVKLRNNMISMFQPEHLLTRSQDLEPAYHDAGQFYWFRVEKFLKNPSLVTENTAGIVMPEWLIQDIDNEEDWIKAEIKYRILQEQAYKKNMALEKPNFLSTTL